MIILKHGNILDAKENIICHQCNTEGIFGGGLAAQIGLKHPLCERCTFEYASLAKDVNDTLVGSFYLYKTDKYFIANCFSQNDDYSTNYIALYKIFSKLFLICKHNNFSIALPYKYGCGIASGDWDVVRGIISELSNTFNINVTIYRLDGGDIE